VSLIARDPTYRAKLTTEETVILTPTEMLCASQYGCLRQLQNIKNGARPRYGAGEEGAWEVHILGCMAEMAVAKYLNLFWAAAVGDYEALDVGGLVQVRSRMGGGEGPKVDLILHPKDGDDHPFVLVYSKPPEFRLAGWIMGSEGKRTDLWGDPAGTGRHAFFVPPGMLKDMASLRAWVALRRAA
jgi:hypothetical protein